jgi:23S rRNA (pseudouridine1915-N3)-methyltransferase
MPTGYMYRSDILPSMILRVIAIGKLKERHWQEGVADYSRRLKPYARMELLEIPEARIPEGGASEETEAMAEEARAILEKLDKKGGLTIALDRQGKEMSSLDLSHWLQKEILYGKSEINWVIGGPLGLSPLVLGRADLVLSFSRMTFPHQMARLMLMEQIYRSFRIMKGEPYHR